MKSFSELSRKVFSIQGEMQLYMRFKEKGCNLQKRKELRRLKNINTYSREYTGILDLILHRIAKPTWMVHTQKI